MPNLDLKNTVINNVLCYISTTRNVYSASDIIRICHAFYEAKEIKDWKDLLHNLVGENSIRRRLDDRLKAELQDILDAFEKCDQNQFVLPTFVADSYRAMPPSSGFEVVGDSLNTLRNEIDLLREEIKELRKSKEPDVKSLEDYIDIREELADLKKMMLSLSRGGCQSAQATSNSRYRTESVVVSSGGGASVVAAPSVDSVPSAGSVPSVDSAHSVDSAEVLCLGDGGDRGIPGSSGGCHERPRLDVGVVVSDEVDNPAKENVNSIQNGFRGQGKDAGWTLVQSKKARRNLVHGSKKTSQGGLHGAPRTADIFIGGCELSVTGDIVVGYCKDELNVEPLECVDLNSKSNYSKSFRVRVYMKDRDSLLCSEKWPENIVIRKFFSRRTESF